MWQIFIGSIVLSLIHALIPHHWLPIVAISKSEKWTDKEAVFTTFVTGFFHMLSTILIGVFVGFVGIKLAEKYQELTHWAAPVILFLFGTIYLILDFVAKRHQHHHVDMEKLAINNKRSKLTILFSLSLAMFLTPCLEIEAFYFQAAIYGWAGILMVSAVYLVMTLTFMLVLVWLALKGIQRLNLHFLEHHSKLISGIVLIVLGVIAYFIEF